MNTKDKIKFWRSVKKMIRSEYGKPCKDIDLNCSVCKANLVVLWIDNHIELLNWVKNGSNNTNI